jgi:hypothetical protein
MEVEVRIVETGRGWRWIVGGIALFRKSPLIWAVVVLILYVALKVLMRISVLGLVAILLLPIFLVGLMEGCRALERGEALQVNHLLSGFRTNVGPLITLGGISLVGNLLIAMIITAIGGDAMMTIMKFAGQTSIAPEAVHAVQQAMSKATLAATVGAALSLPLMMALWFAPLLVYFHGMKPLRAIVYSFWACWKNAMPFLLYGLVVLAALIMVMPVSLATRQIDLGLWLLAPILIPTIYTSYRDLFHAGDAPASGENPLPT